MGVFFRLVISNLPTAVLRIVSLQVEIERLAGVAKSDKDYANITGMSQLLCNTVLSRVNVTELNVWRHQLCRANWTIWWPEFRMKIVKTPNWVSHGYQGGTMKGLQCCWKQEIHLIPCFLSVFQIMAQQDEIVRLRKQDQSQKQDRLKQIQGEKLPRRVRCVHEDFFSIGGFFLTHERYRECKKIKQSLCLWEGLENELQDIRGQIQEKTSLLDSSDLTITNLSKVPLLGGTVTVLRSTQTETDWFCSQPLRSWHSTDKSNRWRTRYRSSRKPTPTTPEVMK